MIKGNVQRVLKSRYLPFIVLALIMLPLHFLFQRSGDDVLFGQALNERTLLSYINERYLIWTSRYLIEAVTIAMCTTNFVIFRFLNVFFILLLTISISRLIDRNASRTANWLIVLLFLIYPFMEMSSAGWSATCVNYLWTMGAGLFAFIPFVKTMRNQEIKGYEYPLYIVAVLFAANHEQVALLLFGFGMIFFYFLFLKTRKINKFLLLWNVIVILSLVNILISPGNAARSASETNTWFIGFDQLSAPHKFYMGASNTLNYLFNDRNILFLILAAMVFYAVYKRCSGKGHRAIACIPLIFSVVTNLDYLTGMRGTWLPFAGRFFSSLNLQEVPYTGFSTLIPAGVASVMLGLILLSVYFAYGKSKQSLLVIVMICAGLAASVTLGFSPTVYASASRVFFPMNMIFLAVIALLFNFEKGTFAPRDRNVLFAILAAFALFSYFDLFGSLLYAA